MVRFSTTVLIDEFSRRIFVRRAKRKRALLESILPGIAAMTEK
jgi:hypothetical protein